MHINFKMVDIPIYYVACTIWYLLSWTRQWMISRNQIKADCCINSCIAGKVSVELQSLILEHWGTKTLGNPVSTVIKAKSRHSHLTLDSSIVFHLYVAAVLKISFRTFLFPTVNLNISLWALHIYWDGYRLKSGTKNV